MKTTILPNNSPISIGINSYINKIKQEQKLQVIKKTYSPKNTYALLDFLIHASVAKDNLYLLSEHFKDNQQISIELRKFDKLFATLDQDFEIMRKQNNDDLAYIMDNIDELATNIAFLNIVNNKEFHKAVNDYSKYKSEIGKFVDEINNESEYKYFKFVLPKSQKIVKNICEFIVHLIFVEYWSDKFVNVSGYNSTEIKSYAKNLINLLVPIATKGLKEEFLIETNGDLAENYKETCQAFFHINTSAKVEFMRLFSAYNSNAKKLLSSISNFKFNYKMDKINKLAELTAQAQTEAQAFYGKGNKAAGTRLRKIMMEIKTIASDVRKDVSETKNANS